MAIPMIKIPVAEFREAVIDLGIHCHFCGKKCGHFCSGTPQDCEQAIFGYLREWVLLEEAEDCSCEESSEAGLCKIKGLVPDEDEEAEKEDE